MTESTNETREPIAHSDEKIGRPVFNRKLMIVLFCMSLPFILAMVKFSYWPKPKVTTSNKMIFHSYAFLPDGQSIVIGGNLNSALILDASSGTVIKRFAVKSDRVVSVDVSHDGKTAALCEIDGMFSLWNVETGQRIASRSLARNTQTESSMDSGVSRFRIALSPDASSILFNDLEGEFRLIESRNGKIVHALDTRNKRNLSWFDFTPDGKNAIAFDSNDRILRIIDLADYQVKQYPTGSFEFSMATFTLDGNNLIMGGKDGRVQLWDRTSGQFTALFQHPEMVTAIERSRDGSRLLIGGNNGVITIWNLISNQFEKSFYREPAMISALSNPGGGENLFVMERSGKFWKWDGIDNQCRWSIEGVNKTAKGEFASAEKDLLALPSTTDLSGLTIRFNKNYDFKDEGIDNILATLQSATGFTITLNDTIQHRIASTPVSGASLLESALKLCSLDYLIQTDGTIRIGRTETLKKYEKNDSKKRALDIPELQSTHSTYLEFVYISDVVKAIDPLNQLTFIIEDEPFKKVTLHLERPTPLQLLDAVFASNGLDYSINDYQIFVDRKENLTGKKKNVIDSSQSNETAILNRTKQILAGVYRIQDKSLRDILEDLRSHIDFSYATDENLDAKLSIELDSPTLTHLLNSILPQHGLAYGVQSDGVIRIDRIEDIETNDKLYFTPEQLACFLIQYHARFKTTRTVYSGTDRCIGYKEIDGPEIDQYYLLEDIEHVRELREKGYEEISDRIQSKQMKNLLAAWKSVSDEDLATLIEQKIRTKTDIVREATRCYSVERDYRRLDVQWPGDPLPLHYYLLTEEGEKVVFPNSPIESRMYPVLKYPDRPFRFGADLDWFLLCGYKIQNINWRERKFQLAPICPERNRGIYEFTWLNGHNAYWTLCETLSYQRKSRRIQCSDFTDISGMLVPQTVQVQDIEGKEFFYLDERIVDRNAGLLTGAPVQRFPFLGGAPNQYDYEMKLVEAAINQPIEKKP